MIFPSDRRCQECGDALHPDCWWKASCAICFDAHFAPGGHRHTPQATQQRGSLGVVIPFRGVEQHVVVAA